MFPLTTGLSFFNKALIRSFSFVEDDLIEKPFFYPTLDFWYSEISN